MSRARLVAMHRWKNGMEVSTRVYSRAPTKTKSDVIEFEIKPAPGRGRPAKFLMNLEDSAAIVHAVSTAMVFVIDKGAPVRG